MALVFVIYAMIEAGKPERWYWLLPPESRPDNAGPKAIQIEILKPDEQQSGAPIESRSTEKPSTDLSFQDRDLNAVPDQVVAVNSQTAESIDRQPSPLPKLARLESADYPEAAQQFWSAMLRRMSADQRRELFLLLKRARHRQQLNPENVDAFQALLDSIQTARTKYHAELIDGLAYSKDSTQERAKLANDHFEAEAIWDRGEYPALQQVLAGRQLDDEQGRVLGQLQSVLDGLILDFVSDRTAQGWEGDSPAWGRMWERLLHEQPSAPTPVTHLELSAQPDTYRNRRVQIRGWVRGAWREALPIKELGIESLYVLVVRPEDSKVTPFFLYTRDLPLGFPPIQGQYQTLNQRIVADGLFFKIRTYLDTQRMVQLGPMILVDQIQLVQTGHSTVSAMGQRFEPAWLALGAVLLTGLGTGVGWIAFRSSKAKRFRTGPNRTRELHQQLNALAKNPAILTDQDRIRDLYEHTN